MKYFIVLKGVRTCLQVGAMLLLATVLSGCAMFERDDRLPRSHFDDRQAAQTETLLAALETLRTRIDEQHEQLSELRDKLAIVQARQLAGDDDEDDRSERQATLEALDEMLLRGDIVVLGGAEWLALPDQDIVVAARVDSGAASSSISATSIEEFERDGSTWVRFTVSYIPGDPNEADDESEERSVEVETPLESRVRIRQASGVEERLVVRLPVELGPIREEARFTLTDREGMTYPALIGRELLLDIAVIDVSKKFSYPKPELP